MNKVPEIFKPFFFGAELIALVEKMVVYGVSWKDGGLLFKYL